MGKRAEACKGMACQVGVGRGNLNHRTLKNSPDPPARPGGARPRCCNKREFSAKWQGFESHARESICHAVADLPWP